MKVTNIYKHEIVEPHALFTIHRISPFLSTVLLLQTLEIFSVGYEDVSGHCVFVKTYKGNWISVQMSDSLLSPQF